MINGVNFVKIKNTGWSVAHSSKDKIDFLAEARDLYSTKLFDRVSVFSSVKQLVAGEKLIFYGRPGNGTVRCLQYGYQSKNQSERKKVLDALLTIRAQYIFLEGCQKNINVDDILESERCYKNIKPVDIFLSKKYHIETKKIYSNVSNFYYENIRQGHSDTVGKLFKDMLIVRNSFGVNADAGEYKPGQGLNSDQVKILEEIDPVFIYFYLIRGVEICPIDRNNASLIQHSRFLTNSKNDQLKKWSVKKDNAIFNDPPPGQSPSAIHKLETFFNKKTDEEVVVICNKTQNFENFFGKKGLPQSFYKLDCSESLYHAIRSAPIFNSKENGGIDRGQLVFCGDPNFGTIRYLEQKTASTQADSKTVRISAESKKRILDVLFMMNAEHVFQEGFFGDIEKSTISEEESIFIDSLKETFKGYTPGRPLNKFQMEILENQNVSVLYYHLAKQLFGKDIKLHPTTTEEEVQEEDIFFDKNSIQEGNNILSLSKENTNKLTAKREECAVSQIMQFFRGNRGAHIAVIFSEGSDLRRFCGAEVDTKIFKEKFIPQYFEFSTAGDGYPNTHTLNLKNLSSLIL